MRPAWRHLSYISSLCPALSLRLLASPQRLHAKSSLHCVGLRSEGLVSLASAVADYRALEMLVLSRNQIACNGFGEASAAGVEALCRAVWQTKKLATLVLADNGLDYLSCVPIAKMLAETHTLATLDVSRNPVGDAGAVHLASGIKKNASLRALKYVSDAVSCHVFPLVSCRSTGWH